VFKRRDAIVELLRNLPEELPVELFGFVVTIDIVSLTDSANELLRSLAISLAADAIFIVLQVGMFVLSCTGSCCARTRSGRRPPRSSPGSITTS